MGVKEDVVGHAMLDPHAVEECIFCNKLLWLVKMVFSPIALSAFEVYIEELLRSKADRLANSA